MKNGFHVNGDQTKSGYSKFTYRPFTLEGNFAFAAALQEMLLQSYAGFIEIMPALPDGWHNVSFENLRAEGAFLVSAEKKEGQITQVTIVATQGGKTRIRLPFEKWESVKSSRTVVNELPGFLEITLEKGDAITIKNADY